MQNSEEDNPSMVPDDTWVLIPVHNRRRITLNCLAHLRKTQKWEQLNVVVIDDGSTDGTAEAVKTKYPTIHLLEGNGDFWWGGAIKSGMKYAKEREGEVLIWLNDDVLPAPNAVGRIAKKAVTENAVLAGMVEPASDQEYTTGNKKRFWRLESQPYNSETTIQPCDATAGKFTAIPNTVVETIGFPDSDRFPHHNCDYEYTLRASEMGFEVGVYMDAKALDTAFELSPGRLSSSITVEQVIRNTFEFSRHSPYSLRTMYYRDQRFVGSGSVLSYFVFSFHVLKIFLEILLKLVYSIQIVGNKHDRNP